MRTPPVRTGNSPAGASYTIGAAAEPESSALRASVSVVAYVPPWTTIRTPPTGRVPPWLARNLRIALRAPASVASGVELRADRGVVALGRNVQDQCGFRERGQRHAMLGLFVGRQTLRHTQQYDQHRASDQHDNHLSIAAITQPVNPVHPVFPHYPADRINKNSSVGQLDRR